MLDGVVLAFSLCVCQSCLGWIRDRYSSARPRRSSSYAYRRKKWGSYLSERQWGTVREDYSEDGNAWDYFSHDQARSRAYRWGEDGLGGLCDGKQQLCFALALWSERDANLYASFCRNH